MSREAIGGLECIYVPELSEETTVLQVTGDEFRHLKALRVRIGESFAVSNGNGLAAKAHIANLDKTSAELEVGNIYPEYGELPFKFGIALGILENKDRFEFALEKCTELGITDFYPLITDFTQRKNSSTERLTAKAIAALKQCKRSRLPKIHEVQKVSGLPAASNEYSRLILLDENGTNPSAGTGTNISTLLVIGPEGGFSPKELELLGSDKRTALWSLGNRRLRAETAAIVAAGILSAQ